MLVKVGIDCSSSVGNLRIARFSATVGRAMHSHARAGSDVVGGRRKTAASSSSSPDHLAQDPPPRLLALPAMRTR